MKNKLFYIVLTMVAITAIMLTSCSKEKRIEGKWKIDRASGEFSDDKGETWTFKSNGTCICYLGGLDLDGEWSLSQDDLSIELDMRDYGYDAKKVLGDFTIDKLSSNEMSISGVWKIMWVDGGSDNSKASYDFEKK